TFTSTVSTTEATTDTTSQSTAPGSRTGLAPSPPAEVDRTGPGAGRVDVPGGGRRRRRRHPSDPAGRRARPAAAMIGCVAVSTSRLVSGSRRLARAARTPTLSTRALAARLARLPGAGRRERALAAELAQLRATYETWVPPG